MIKAQRWVSKKNMGGFSVASVYPSQIYTVKAPGGADHSALFVKGDKPSATERPPKAKELSWLQRDQNLES